MLLRIEISPRLGSGRIEKVSSDIGTNENLYLLALLVFVNAATLTCYAALTATDRLQG